MNFDLLYNTFLNNYLWIFYTSFPLKSSGESLQKPLDYIGYKDFCSHKKFIYLLSRDSNIHKSIL
jgi:hypothetical protein